MTKVQNSLFANNITLAGIEDSSFVQRGENVVVLGLRRNTRDFASKLHAACVAAGRKVVVATAGNDVNDKIADGDPELVSDLLLIVDRRASDLGGKPKGEHYADLLTRRIKLGRSSIVLSETMPVDWEANCFLGNATFWTAARLGMGIILNHHNPERRAIYDRVRIGSNSGDRAFFNATNVASLDWIRDEAIYEYFGITGKVAPWHWIDLNETK